jgi:ABC-type transporter MlaC component
MKKRILLSSLLLVLFAAACTAAPQSTPVQSLVDPNAQPQSAIVESQPLAVNPTQEAMAAEAAAVNELIAAPAEYPNTPEGVIQAFLSAYALDQSQMNQYLLASQASALQGQGAGELLQLNGSLDEFVIDAGAVNPETLEAFVSVAIQSGGSETRRNIFLSQENGQWKVSRVETAVDPMQPPQS